MVSVVLEAVAVPGWGRWAAPRALCRLVCGAGGHGQGSLCRAGSPRLHLPSTFGNVGFSFFPLKFKKPKARLLGRPWRGCGSAEVPPCLNCSHRQREKFPSKATRSQAAEGSLHRFMCRNPSFGRFFVNCVQTSFEKFPCSSWEAQAGARGERERPLPHATAGTLKYEHLAFYYTI